MTGRQRRQKFERPRRVADARRRGRGARENGCARRRDAVSATDQGRRGGDAFCPAGSRKQRPQLFDHRRRATLSQGERGRGANDPRSVNQGIREIVADVAPPVARARKTGAQTRNAASDPARQPQNGSFRSGDTSGGRQTERACLPVAPLRHAENVVQSTRAQLGKAEQGLYENHRHGGQTSMEFRSPVVPSLAMLSPALVEGQGDDMREDRIVAGDDTGPGAETYMLIRSRSQNPDGSISLGF